MRKSLLFLLLTSIILECFSQQSNPIDSIQDDFDIYGFFQVQTVLQNEQYHINDGSTHIGVDFVKRISPNLAFYAQVEIGLSLVTSENFDAIIDPNSDRDFFDLVSPNSNTFGFSGRLGFVGVDLGKYGKFSVGKQWSVYYDVAGWTDYWYNFGADVTPAYWNDTDGGYSGTGRANNASIYRVALPFGTEIGLQAQAINKRYSFGASVVQNIRAGGPKTDRRNSKRGTKCNV
jgi:predicted porin